MRAAYVIPSLQTPSGWRTHAAGFLHAISAHVEAVLFATPEDAPQAKLLFPEYPLFELPVTQRFSAGSISGVGRLASCRRQVRRMDTSSLQGVDLVHSLEAYPTGLVGHWLARRLECPHVLTAHGTYGVVWHAHPLDRRLYQGVLRNARLVCPVSQGTARLMQRYFGHALERTRVQPILNGNDYWKSVPQSQALERAFPAEPVLLTVGAVKPRKGQHVSLAAFAIVKAKLPAARYLIVGETADKGYYARLQRYVAEQKLADVSFLGAVSDEELAKYYRQASAFVLTPQAEGLHFEGFGLVYLEAGAYGLPVVATCTGGVPDAVQDGGTGLLALPDDVEGLAVAMLRLLTDPELNLSLGRANRQWAEVLTWEHNAAEHYKAYQEVLGTS